VGNKQRGSRVYSFPHNIFFTFDLQGCVLSRFNCKELLYVRDTKDLVSSPELNYFEVLLLCNLNMQIY